MNTSGEQQTLYLTTTGWKTGRPREIEIWFVSSNGKIYIFAEQHHKAHWVQNVERDTRVQVRIGDHAFAAQARVLDPARDADVWETAQQLAWEKYGWGEELPVEITPEGSAFRERRP